ncbi:hypothetical protein [Streptomyces sp. NPDC056244]|uniref:hypothetical protein n=1 Tax=Streptomyces sp. NPDC056244 TaxID=3345762 RepID=UPI0035D76285
MRETIGQSAASRAAYSTPAERALSGTPGLRRATARAAEALADVGRDGQRPYDEAFRGHETGAELRTRGRDRQTSGTGWTRMPQG